jgi:outer membrane receptor protein involved in Fe transport
MGYLLRRTGKLTLLGLLLPGGFAWAAEADEQGAVEEIIVTATLRETNLMETPQAISAVSAEQIDQLGATDMQGLYRNITGLNMTEGQRTGQNRYTVRGVSSQTGTLSYAQTFAAVSVYLDDIPMTSAQGPAKQFGGNLFDMDRVEVLKGPQGTLYGEGSVGGTIRFIQNKPQLGETDWKVKGTIHNTDESDDGSHRIDAMLNLPLSDSFAVRINAYTVDRAGWIDKTDLNDDDFNTESSDGVRLAGLWSVNDRLTLEGAFYTSETESEGGVVAQTPYEEGLNVRQPGRPPFAEEEIDIISLNLDYEFDFATLELAYSNMDREGLSENEFPGSVAAAFDSFIQANVIFRGADNPNEVPTLLSEGWIINPDFVTISNQLAFNTNDTASSDRDTFEAKLLSSGDGAWRWTTGVFWKDSDDIRSNFQPFLLIPSLTNAPAVNALYTEFYNDPSNDHVDTLDEISVFGEATYAINDSLELTVGGRWTDLEQTLEDSAAETSDQVFSPKVGLAWTVNESTLTYFNITTGFRPGNVNLGQEFNARQLSGAGDNVVPATPFAPNPDNLTGNEAAAIATSRIAYDGDSVVNYELGIKTRLFDNRWNLTASLYYFDWEDTILTFQQANLPTINRAYNDNAGAAHTQGIEFDVVGNITDNLRLRFGADFNEAELDEAVGAIPSGTELPNVPEWSWHTTLDYTAYVGDGYALNFMVNHTAMAEQQQSLGGTIEIPERQQTDLRVSLSGPNEFWDASLFATNITNEDEFVVDCSGFGNPVCFTYQPPATIGFDLTVRRP